jgi:hypothetical protein
MSSPLKAVGLIAFNLEVFRMRGELSRLPLAFDELRIEYRLTKLFSRIENIRQLNYRSQTNLEDDQIKAAELWMSIEPSFKEKIKSGIDTCRVRTKFMETELEPLSKSPDMFDGDLGVLDPLKKEIDAYKAEANEFIAQIRQDLTPLPSLLESIEQRVSTVEIALDLTSKASFKLKEDEALLIALKAKDMHRKTDGILTFTNQRMMFESLPTKKTERQLLLEKPVGLVAKIAKGKVGMFEPEGLCVEFKQPNDPKLKFGTTLNRGCADLAVQYFDIITSGKIDEELKSGVNVALRHRFKELATKHFPDVSFCRGTCKECGTVVSAPMKTYTLDGGPIIGLFNCPKCHKPFRAVLARE